MTYQPPQDVPYETPAPQGKSGMALTAMILGIIGVPLMCAFGVGVIPCLVALVLGIVALVRANRRPQEYGGKGYAITGIVLGALAPFVAVPLLIAILLPSLGRARELSNRSYCAANLRGITQSMVVYANENSDVFPVTLPPATATEYKGFSASGSAGTDKQTLQNMYGSGGQHGDVTGSLWILVLSGQTTPKQYMCKSDPYAGPTGSPINDAGGNFNSNFNGGATLSYSIAYPWVSSSRPANNASPAVVGGWWKNMTDASLPLMADMAPLNGSGSPRVNVAGSGKERNSRNHGGDGQIVAYGDAHASFERTPEVGQNMDNIWSLANGATPGAVPGQLGGVIMTEAVPYDVVMVPVRDAGTGTVK